MYAVLGLVNLGRGSKSQWGKYEQQYDSMLVQGGYTLVGGEEGIMSQIAKRNGTIRLRDAMRRQQETRKYIWAGYDML